MTEKYNVSVDTEDVIGATRVSDAISEVSHKPMSL